MCVTQCSYSQLNHTVIVHSPLGYELYRAPCGGYINIYQTGHPTYFMHNVEQYRRVDVYNQYYNPLHTYMYLNLSGRGGYGFGYYYPRW